MSRGLSDLQKTILLTALKKPGRTVHSDGTVLGTDARHRDIHAAHYGAAPRTNANRVAISRAADRLAKRGLVDLMEAAHSRWSGVNLTQEGESVANSLTDNKVVTLPPY